MIEGLSLKHNGFDYFWNDELYYRDVFPLLKEKLSKDEIFIMSKWDDKFSRHDQKLYHSNIRNINIKYEDDGRCNVNMSLYSYRMKLDIAFYDVSNFRFFQDDETKMFHEIYGVYIVYDKKSKYDKKKKRFYFLCAYFPEKERAFHFIEYERLMVNNLEIYETIISESGIVVKDF